MTFRFINSAGRSALVDDHDQWFDLERLTNGAVPADPMAAIANGAALHAAAALLATAAPDGDLATAELQAQLLALELQGELARLPGGQFVRVAQG